MHEDHARGRYHTTMDHEASPLIDVVDYYPYGVVIFPSPMTATPRGNANSYTSKILGHVPASLVIEPKGGAWFHPSVIPAKFCGVRSILSQLSFPDDGNSRRKAKWVISKTLGATRGSNIAWHPREHPTVFGVCM